MTKRSQRSQRSEQKREPADVEEIIALHTEIRALVVNADSRNACMALMLMIAEVIGSSYDGPIDSIFGQLRTLIEEAKAAYTEGNN